MNYMRCHDFLFFARMEKEDGVQVCKKWFIDLYFRVYFSSMAHGSWVISLFVQCENLDYPLTDRSSSFRF